MIFGCLLLVSRPPYLPSFPSPFYIQSGAQTFSEAVRARQARVKETGRCRKTGLSRANSYFQKLLLRIKTIITPTYPSVRKRQNHLISSTPGYSKFMLKKETRIFTVPRKQQAQSSQTMPPIPGRKKAHAPSSAFRLK